MYENAASELRVVELFIKEAYEESNEAIDALLQSHAETSFLLFCRGRNFRYLKQYDLAVHWLLRSLETSEPFIWSHYELANTYMSLEQADLATHSALAFLLGQIATGDMQHLNEIHLNSIQLIAHACFVTNRPLAFELYKIFDRLALPADYLTELRLCELDLQDADVESAYSRISSLSERRNLDIWGLLTFSQIQEQRGAQDLAVHCVKAALALGEGSPRSQGYLRALNRLIDLRESELARPFVESFLMLSPESRDSQVESFIFRYVVTLYDITAAVRLLESDFFDTDKVDTDVMAEAVYLAADYRFRDEVDRRTLVSCLTNRLEVSSHSDKSVIVKALIHALMWSRDYLRAKKALQKATEAGKLEPETVVMLHFEILCFCGEIDEANVLYDQCVDSRALSNWEAVLVLRFLAERRLDEKAAVKLLNLIENGSEIPAENYLYLQICRKANYHSLILNALACHLRENRLIHLRDFRQLLVDDLCLVHGKPFWEVPGESEKAMMSANNRILLRTRQNSKANRQGKIAAFLCSNSSYFLSAITFLISFITHNERREDLEWVLFLGEDVPSNWLLAVEILTQKLGLPVEVVRESSILDTQVSHKEKYGMFTGGNTLSRAAYFRIYAAKFLLERERSRFERSFYFDTDIICQGPLEDLFNCEFAGRLLLARTEGANDDVRKAAMSNDIDPLKYFNSGVLAFDFSRSETLRCLNEAIWLSENEPHRLVFHDQCALNVAFANQTGEINPKYNWYLHPDRYDNGDLSRGVLLHYLDRPKPWDVGFSRGYRGGWSNYAGLARSLIPSEIFSEIVKVSNGLNAKQRLL